ncbi:zinc transporter ZIP3 [Petromyzon marinus]|uniref:Zinc transporter ZIP3 n=1 Tax=Petromyzon marinus TaxID=7757 RepID=A0AAJ7TZV9_PETMA|nr:zinc transporter ZIP3 [Petromyzon marinus]XP_032827231.1 zinc transporter ZIP3 [Petromyzon marinus]XP_032827232.1 zinc transporter ZIP3 [Petromyzon marinus]XP_032827233.1 zinc transporter ZIP3 [Petromyzon marinus]XP_032827234.1 zinc transporter ZIP3 [Petromyzon marinus]XP_032827235.1 zinc transporter ZIP3 [Petromyzon marinus]
MAALLLLKALCALAMFVLMSLGCLLPVWLLRRAEAAESRRARRLMAAANTFAGGVFLGTCFCALLPSVREKAFIVGKAMGLPDQYPLAECCMVLGLLLTLLLEQLVLVCRRSEPPPRAAYVGLDSLDGDAGADSDTEAEEEDADETGSPAPLKHVRPPPGRRQQQPRRHRHHRHHRQQPQHGHGHSHLDAAELAESSSLRLIVLVLALSAHSAFEGVALGLQETAAKAVGLAVAVGVHETLAAAALGASMARAGLAPCRAARLAAAFCTAIPVGVAIGAAVENGAAGLAGDAASLVLQGLAAGTFLFVAFLEVLAKEMAHGQRDRMLKVALLAVGYALPAGLAFMHW